MQPTHLICLCSEASLLATEDFHGEQQFNAAFLKMAAPEMRTFLIILVFFLLLRVSGGYAAASSFRDC